MTWPDWERLPDDGGGRHWGLYLLFGWGFVGTPLMAGFEVRWYVTMATTLAVAAAGLVLELQRSHRVKQRRRQADHGVS